MEEKKNSKGLIWLIVILIVLVLGLVGYIVYDKVLNNKENNNSLESIEVDEKITEKTDDTIEKRFNKYIANYKENLKTNSNNKNIYILNYIISPNPERITDNVEYYLTLDKNNSLYLTSKESSNPNIRHELISKDVIQYYVITDPLSGEHTIYYITFKGEVYKSDLATAILKDDVSLIKFEKLNMEYIINIIDYKDEKSAEISENYPLFIDVDGKIYLD